MEADHGIVRLSIVSGITAIGDDGIDGVAGLKAEEAATWLGGGIQIGRGQRELREAEGVSGVSLLRGDIAALTVDALYLLDASDLKAAEETQFFCGVTGSPLTVEITIPALPPGKYALAILHATGVQQPQQLSLVLENDPAGSPDWKLAGFFTRPMTMGGHDGVWFWTQARDYAAKKQLWDAWFYYQTAQYLLDPVDFISSPNLQKLQREAEQARPDNLPGSDPLHLSSGTQTFDIVSLHTGELSNQLDLVVTYNATPNQDPVTARAQVTAVMRGLLQQHPELLTAFHGLWVYAATPGNQSPFALELPMGQIQNSVPPPGQHS